MWRVKKVLPKLCHWQKFIEKKIQYICCFHYCWKNRGLCNVGTVNTNSYKFIMLWNIYKNCITRYVLCGKKGFVLRKNSTLYCFLSNLVYKDFGF